MNQHGEMFVQHLLTLIAGIQDHTRASESHSLDFAARGLHPLLQNHVHGDWTHERTIKLLGYACEPNCNKSVSEMVASALDDDA